MGRRNKSGDDKLGRTSLKLAPMGLDPRISFNLLEAPAPIHLAEMRKPSTQTAALPLKLGCER